MSQTDSNADATPTDDVKDDAIDFKRDVVDRRMGLDRRQMSREESGYTGPERRVASRRSGLERRRGAGIRREEDRRSAEEGEMTAEQFEFIRAVETYKRVNAKMFPTWTEVLEVVQQLGYRKAEKREVDLPNVPEPDLWLPRDKGVPAPGEADQGRHYHDDDEDDTYDVAA